MDVFQPASTDAGVLVCMGQTSLSPGLTCQGGGRGERGGLKARQLIKLLRKRQRGPEGARAASFTDGLQIIIS